jgi:hypothetical protein
MTRAKASIVLPFTAAEVWAFVLPDGIAWLIDPSTRARLIPDPDSPDGLGHRYSTVVTHEGTDHTWRNEIVAFEPGRSAVLRSIGPDGHSGDAETLVEPHRTGTRLTFLFHSPVPPAYAATPARWSRYLKRHTAWQLKRVRQLMAEGASPAQPSSFREAPPSGPS